MAASIEAGGKIVGEFCTQRDGARRLSGFWIFAIFLVGVYLWSQTAVGEATKLVSYSLPNRSETEQSSLSRIPTNEVGAELIHHCLNGVATLVEHFESVCQAPDFEDMSDALQATDRFGQLESTYLDRLEKHGAGQVLASNQLREFMWLAWRLNNSQRFDELYERMRYRLDSQEAADIAVRFEGLRLLAHRQPREALRLLSIPLATPDELTPFSEHLGELRKLALRALGAQGVCLSAIDRVERALKIGELGTRDMIVQHRASLLVVCEWARERVTSIEVESLLHVPPVAESLRASPGDSAATTVALRLAGSLKEGFERCLERRRLGDARQILGDWRDVIGQRGELEFLQLLSRLEDACAVEARQKFDLDSATEHLRRSAEAWYLRAGLREKSRTFAVDDRLQAALAWERAGDFESVRVVLQPLLRLSFEESVQIHQERTQLADAFVVLGRSAMQIRRLELAARVLKRVIGELDLAEGFSTTEVNRRQRFDGSAFLDPVREAAMLELARVDLLSSRSREDLEVLSRELSPHSPRWKGAVYHLGVAAEMNSVAAGAGTTAGKEFASAARRYYEVVVASGFEDHSCGWWLHAAIALAELAKNEGDFELARKAYVLLRKFPRRLIYSDLSMFEARKFTGLCAEASFFEAEMLWRLERFEESAAAFRKASIHYGQSRMSPWAHWRLGQHLSDIDRCSEATDHWREGLDVIVAWPGEAPKEFSHWRTLFEEQLGRKEARVSP